MNVLSFPFFVFLAALVLVYYITPLRVRKWVLLVGSGIFWVSHGISGAAYLACETGLVWGSACFIGKRQAQGKSGKAAFIATLVIVLSAMMLMKEHLQIESVVMREMLGVEVPPAWELSIPLGISYFTFQSAGYLIDVYRKKAKAQRNYLKVLLFCGFFPQLGQGPIGTWRELFPQLDAPHRLDPQRMTAAFMLMVWGYFKKLVIADRIAPFVSSAIASADTLPGWLALLAVIAYTLELYADFSGGIDIIRGAAGLLGVDLAKNFARPFFATSVADYWRRWHISLGAWFRTYVLYPLAVSRAGVAVGQAGKRLWGAKAGRALPGALAAFVVFVLIGLWHTFRWNALIYGCWFGVLSAGAILLEPLFKDWKKRLGVTKTTRWFKVFGMARTWFLVLIAQFFACTASPQQALTLMERICLHFGMDTFGQLSTMTFMAFDGQEWIVAAAALVILLMVDIVCECRGDVLMKLAGARVWIRWPLLLALLMVILIFGRYGIGYDASAFVYAGF